MQASARLARRLVLRALLRERGRALLCILSVALGVGVFLAIRLANRAAVASFEGFARGVGQGADLVVESPAGPLPESSIRALAPLRAEAWFRPVLEGSFALAPSREPFQVLGVDLVGLGNTATQEPEPGPAPDEASAKRAQDAFYTLIQDPAAVSISAALARDRGLKPGDPLKGFVDGAPVTLTVQGIIPEAPNRPAVQRNLLLMDLPAAQALLHREGQVDRLELGVRPGHTAADLERDARALLQGDPAIESLTLVPPEQRAESGRTMTAAFRFNLTILSLIALAVGAYLLFQAFDGAVARRRETWATLRALGCPPRTVLGFVLLEAAILGLLGSALGLLVGWGLAQGAVQAVSRTVDALYGASAARQAALLPGESALAFFIGLGACLVSAWVPARRAAAVPPVQLLARGAELRPMAWKGLALAGAGLMAAGLALAFLPHLPPGVAWHAYGGAALMILGGSLATVGLLPFLGLPGLRLGGWKARLALRPLLRPTGRHGLAAAALAVALGMAVGMGVMVASFERTVLAWIGTSLQADLYVSPAGALGAGSRHRLEPELVDRLAADPDVELLDRFEMTPVTLLGQPTYLACGDFGLSAPRRNLIMAAGGTSAEVMAEIHAGGTAAPGALCSETFARRFGVGLGSVVPVPAPDGLHPVTIRGVFADYGNERGSLILDRSVYLAWFRDPKMASLAAYLKPGAVPEAVAERWERVYPGLEVRSNAGLRRQVVTIFHQTFALTYALELVGVAVALAGLVQALLGLALQRRGELAALRALGAPSRGLAAVLVLEGVGVAGAGLLGGLGLGYLLARLLVEVLNPQVFGWTLAFSLPWGYLAGLAALTLLAAIAALLPAARWAARLAADREAEEGA